MSDRWYRARVIEVKDVVIGGTFEEVEMANTVAVKERPIIFGGEMVREIMNGRKTQTRRVVKPQPPGDGVCPYGQPGDRLWVREKWRVAGFEMLGSRYSAAIEFHDGDHAISRMEGGPELLNERCGWRSSIHMPRWASRITLEITSIRVERLQEITETDAISEGCCNAYHPDFHVGQFRDKWDSINARRGFGWDVNPWVWVIGFKRIAGGE